MGERAVAGGGAGATPVLELRGLHKSFGQTDILRGVSMAVGRGERVGIIGPNGAGKSTLFNLISGRDAPTAGEIWLRGRRVDGLQPHAISRLGMGRSFQVSNLFGRLSVYENLRCAAFQSAGLGYSFWRLLARQNALNARTEALLAALHLTHVARERAMNLSYADQRALEIGIALAGGARLLLLDEPTAGMSQLETTRFIARLRAVTQGKSLLMVEHDMGVVFDLADRIAVLNNGQLLAFDTPERVRANSEVQAAYLGGMEPSRPPAQDHARGEGPDAAA